MAYYVASVAFSKFEVDPSEFDATNLEIRQKLSTFPMIREFNEYYDYDTMPTLKEWVEEKISAIEEIGSGWTVAINAKYYGEEDDSIVEKDFYEVTYRARRTHS
jgi:hypothetical protein